MDCGIVIQTLRLEPGKLFSLCDENGRVIDSFGSHYNQNWTSIVLHDGQTSNVFSSRRFYFFPLYLGFVYLYNEGKLVFRKETIDGLRNMEIRESPDAIKNAKKYMTTRFFAIGSDYIVVVARDKKGKNDYKYYWDVYRLNDFAYLFSLKEPPTTFDIVISKNFLICLDDETLAVYGLNDFLLKVREQCGVLAASNQE